MTPSSIKLAVLLSGSGTTLQNMVDCVAAGTLDAQVKIVIGSRPTWWDWSGPPRRG